MKPNHYLQQSSEEQKMISLFDIAKTVLHIGLASYSLAALGEAKKTLVEKKHWLTDEEYLNGIALSQLLPGAPAVNLNTYIGYFLRGFPGSLIATIFFILPCFTLMVILAHLYLNYNDLPWVNSLFKGVGALVVGLVLNTIIDLWKRGVNSPQLTVLAAGGFLMIYFLKVNILTLLFLAGSVSLCFTFLTYKFKGWQVIMDQRFWLDKKKAERAAVTAKFSFSKKSFGITLALLAILITVNFTINFSDPVYRQLGNTFFRIGGLTFGSGYAMLPFIQDTMVNHYHFLTNEEFGAALALSLLTPGPVTVISAFIGYKVAGVFGAALSMANIYLPAFAMVNLISDLYNRAGKIELIKMVITGIVAAFIGTLWAVILKLAGSSLVDLPTIGIALAAFGLQRFTKIDTLWIILSGAVLSLFIF
ncbi:chromate transporter, chromate ion transporter family [Desulfosporosinus orientis DSM 765]|uniref:Chromate transporter, chromate ion transporter family n=1 Tax=Desulfosporosinus orientis (strain ATCC 19365 / DSM 765 / NCIMB 8382 / VKM B-1628 / Singapore I) TaxID=768706 RepID=G7WIG2_DESOD|nr:chromate efflux transporter [Desulfosporosinus orientis]AET69036.1 chromate transporter, chromate ion transporter family [Desulfosporosinus orientis DSM 765]